MLLMSTNWWFTWQLTGIVILLGVYYTVYSTINRPLKDFLTNTNEENTFIYHAHILSLNRFDTRAFPGNPRQIEKSQKKINNSA